MVSSRWSSSCFYHYIHSCLIFKKEKIRQLYSDKETPMGSVLYLMLALPPAVVGLFARFTGRTYKAKHRIIIGVVGAIVHIGGCILLGLNPLIYLLTPVAFFISMHLAKIKLGRVQLWAIKQEELGQLNIGE